MPTLSSVDPGGRHADRPIAGCCPSTTTQCSHSAAGGRGCHHLCRLLWSVVARPVGEWYKKVFWRLAVNGVRAAGACQCYFSAPCHCGVVGTGAHGDCERLRQHAFWECAIAQAVRTQVQRGLGRCLLQQRHLWLVDPPTSVCEVFWQVVVLAAIWAMEQGRKRLWSLVQLWGQLCSRPFPKRPLLSGLPCCLA
jgi:hypothetical protein